jgi:hypothetical protein
VKSQAKDYRAKAKEYARLTVVTKSLRESRRYRKFADVLGTRASRGIAKRSAVKDDREAEIVMTVYPAEFHRRCDKKWERDRNRQMLVSRFGRSERIRPGSAHSTLA